MSYDSSHEVTISESFSLHFTRFHYTLHKMVAELRAYLWTTGREIVHRRGRGVVTRAGGGVKGEVG